MGWEDVRCAPDGERRNERRHGRDKLGTNGRIARETRLRVSSPLTAILRLDLDVLALLARGVIVFVLAHGHVRLAEELQGDRAHLRVVPRDDRVFQHAIAGLPQYGFDFQFRTLGSRTSNQHLAVHWSVGRTNLEERL